MPGCHPRAGGGGPRGGGLRGLRNANGGEKKPRGACCATWARPPRPGRADSRQGDPSGEAGSRAGERPRLRGLVGVRRVAWAPAARLIPSQTSTLSRSQLCAQHGSYSPTKPYGVALTHLSDPTFAQAHSLRRKARLEAQFGAKYPHRGPSPAHFESNFDPRDSLGSKLPPQQTHRDADLTMWS